VGSLAVYQNKHGPLISVLQNAQQSGIKGSITPWSRVLLEKLIATQLVKKLSAFYGTRMYITVFTIARRWTLSWARWIQSTPSRHIYLMPTQPLIQWVPGTLSLGMKKPAREADHSHLVPTSKNEWSYTSTPQYAFMAWCSVKAQGQLYFYHSNIILPSTPRSSEWFLPFRLPDQNFVSISLLSLAWHF
jgi:hypothetical protein